jgi:hypothetical protein
LAALSSAAAMSWTGRPVILRVHAACETLPATAKPVTRPSSI